MYVMLVEAEWAIKELFLWFETSLSFQLKLPDDSRAMLATHAEC